MSSSILQTCVAQGVRIGVNSLADGLTNVGHAIANWVDPPPAYEDSSDTSIFSPVKQFISAQPLPCLILSILLFGLSNTMLLVLLAYCLFYGVK
jgi:hypothetical protein